MPRRLLGEETLIVLSLSLLASAVFAILSLLEAPLRGVTVASVSQSTQLARQIFGTLFSLAPVWLVVYLVRRSGEGLEGIGLRWDQPRQDIARGSLLFLVVGTAGIGLYLAAVALGVNRFVVPVPPLGHWWTVPVLLLNAAEAALLEEVVVVAYLITRPPEFGGMVTLVRYVVVASIVNLGITAFLLFDRKLAAFLGSTRLIGWWSARHH